MLTFLDGRLRVALLVLVAAAIFVPVLAATPDGFPLHVPPT